MLMGTPSRSRFPANSNLMGAFLCEDLRFPKWGWMELLILHGNAGMSQNPSSRDVWNGRTFRLPTLAIRNF
jgi:hypothetical protein